MILAVITDIFASAVTGRMLRITPLQRKINLGSYPNVVRISIGSLKQACEHLLRHDVSELLTGIYDLFQWHFVDEDVIACRGAAKINSGHKGAVMVAALCALLHNGL